MPQKKGKLEKKKHHQAKPEHQRRKKNKEPPTNQQANHGEQCVFFFQQHESTQNRQFVTRRRRRRRQQEWVGPFEARTRRAMPSQRVRKIMENGMMGIARVRSSHDFVVSCIIIDSTKPANGTIRCCAD
jgi:hypothetical protein